MPAFAHASSFRATWRAAQADAADRLVADLDRDAALEGNERREHALTGSLGLGALGQSIEVRPKRVRRIGLRRASSIIVRLRRRPGETPSAGRCGRPRATDHARRAFVSAVSAIVMAMRDRNVLLRQDLRARGTRH